MTNDTMNQADRDYEQGLGDGYMGAPKVSDPSVTYLMGYEDGVANYENDRSGAYKDDYDFGYEYDAVSQGYYDDDPSPYAGDYSEM